ncbi:MAG TPA: Hsp20/alpha crystallin family protein [Candidatus Udaeobacter sp.]|nr:Hsp20/alpha crystallin family protein [Candidatus Udaeobacter sp.]
MDRLFGDMFETRQQQETRGQKMTFRLPVDIAETDSSYVIKAPVPGFNPDDVELTVSGNVLTINATHKEEKEDKKGNYIRREMSFGDYVRQIALPNDARPDNINATFNNGVLKIEVPRAPKPQPKRIPVQAEAQKQMAGSASR